MIQEINTANILNQAICGIEFEFFSPLKREAIAESMTKFIGTKVIVPKKIVGLDRTIDTYHGDFKPTSSVFKIEPDYSGGGKMHELVTGQLHYKEARKVIDKILNWIAKFGYTTDKCSIHLNVSFDKRFHMKNNTGHLDVLKMILNFDEEYIYTRFPDRRNNIYAKSIREIQPINIFFQSTDIHDINPTNYKLPDTKYYGLNFEKRKDGYMELRYIGGANYEKKKTEIADILNYFILSLYDNLSHPEYTMGDLDKLRDYIRPRKNLVASFTKWETFVHEFPNIRILVDLKPLEDVAKTYFPQIRERLFNFLYNTGMTRGVFNIDTRRGALQVKDADIKGATDINNIEFFNCRVSHSELTDCIFYRSTVDFSHIENCKMLANNSIKNSKITTTVIDSQNKIYNCYIKNDGIVINGNLYHCIVSSGEMGMAAVVDDDTEIVDQETLLKTRTIQNSKK